MLQNLLISTLGVLIGGGLALAAVALGGYLVFKTKKESHQTLWGPQQADGIVATMGDTPGEEESRVIDSSKYPDNLANSQNKFVNQLAEEMVNQDKGATTQ